MAIIRTTTGQVNLQKASAKVMVFHSPKAAGSGHKEVFLDQASKSPQTAGVVRRMNAPTFTPSVPGKKQEIVGRIVEQNFDIADGEIIKVFVNRRPGYGRPPINGNVFLRVRQDAAYRKIKFLFSDSSQVSFTHASVEGPFDLMSLDDLDAAGVVIPDQYRRNASAEAVERVIDSHEVIREERTQAARVRKRAVIEADGRTSTKFQKKKPKRSLDV